MPKNKKSAQKAFSLGLILFACAYIVGLAIFVAATSSSGGEDPGITSVTTYSDEELDDE